MNKKTNRRSSILKTVDENNQGEVTKSTRRVSFHTHRIVKTFNDESEIEKTPQRERIHMSSDQSSNLDELINFNDAENKCTEIDITMTEEKNITLGNETINVFKRIEQHDYSIHKSFAIPAENTTSIFDKLPQCSNENDPNASFKINKTMSLFDSLPKAAFTQQDSLTQFESPTSDKSPFSIDKEAKALFDNVTLSPIKSVQSLIDEIDSNQPDFEIRMDTDIDVIENQVQNQVNMNQDIVHDLNSELDEVSMDQDVAYDLNSTLKKEDPISEEMETDCKEKSITREIEESKSENIVNEDKNRNESIFDVNGSSTYTVCEEKVIVSDKTQNDFTIPFENSEVTDATRRLSSKIKEYKEKKRRSSLLNSSPEVINDILSKMNTSSSKSDRNDTTLQNDVIDEVVENGTYTVENEEGIKITEVQNDSVEQNIRSPMSMMSPIRNESIKLLEDIQTPDKMLTFNETFPNSIAGKTAEPELIEAMMMDDILNCTRSQTIENKSDIDKFSNTIPFAPITPITKHKLPSIFDRLLEENEEEEEEKPNLSITLPHLAKAAQLEKELLEDDNNVEINSVSKIDESIRITDKTVEMTLQHHVSYKNLQEPETENNLFSEELASDSLITEEVNAAGDCTMNSTYLNKKDKNNDFYTLSSYGDGCCARHLNPNEISLMNKLKEEIEQLKVFGEHLKNVSKEIYDICKEMKPELLIYEAKDDLRLIQYYSEIKTIDRFFEANNGVDVCKDINEILCYTFEKAGQAYKTAMNLYREMQVSFPLKKFNDKIAKLMVKDLKTNVGRRQEYMNKLSNRKAKVKEIKHLYEKRVKEVDQELNKQFTELKAQHKEVTELYDETMKQIVSNLKKLAN